MSRKEVSQLLEYGIYIIITLYVISVFLFVSIYEGLGTLIGALVIVYCGNKNEEWASKIDRDVNLAFVFGIVFGLFGLLAYWILYKIRVNNPTPESETNKAITSFFLTIVILIGGIGFGIDLIDRAHEIGDGPSLHKYKMSTPTPVSFATTTPFPYYPTTKQVSSFEEYGFSFDYPSDMIILKEGYLSDKANEYSGLVFAENKRQTKDFIIRWYSTTQPMIEDELQEGIVFLKEEFTDLSVSNVKILTIKSNPQNSLVYQTLNYRIEGFEVYSTIGLWYDIESQRVFYIGIDTYDERETNNLFNNIVNSFTSQPMQLSQFNIEITNWETKLKTESDAIDAFENKWGHYTKSGMVANPDDPTGRSPYIRGIVFIGTDEEYEKYEIDYDEYIKHIDKFNELLKEGIDKY